ncbi:MAG: 16S rRNA (guanine(527)-N(7))-methyltransferase RsmG [Deltaproteobacteria bacterium]
MKREIRELLVQGGNQLGIELKSQEVVKFSELSAELNKWNKKINLTSIRDDSDVVLKHFIDSLSLLKVIGKEGRLLDVGSGGGFPAIPLKIMLPLLSVVSVDAVEKKILFQRHVARILRLQDFSALHARVEELSLRYPLHFNWIVSRAFSDIPAFVKIALPLLKDNGCIVAMKGKKGKEEAVAAEKECLEMGVAVTAVLDITLPVTGATRCLVLMQKREWSQGNIHSKKTI